MNWSDRKCERCHERPISGPRARFCRHCRHRGGKPKYVVTDQVEAVLRACYDSTVPGRAAEIAAEIGWSRCAVKKAATKLGLTRPWPADRRSWTSAEDAVLVEWQGLHSARSIGKKIGRGETSVILRMKRLGLSRRVRNGYSARDLARCFGVDDKVVCRWCDQGWLSSARQGTRRANDVRRISRAAVLDFIREHREQYVLRKVDQAWFLDLVLGSADQQTTGADQPTSLQLDEDSRGRYEAIANRRRPWRQTA